MSWNGSDQADSRAAGRVSDVRPTRHGLAAPRRRGMFVVFAAASAAVVGVLAWFVLGKSDGHPTDVENDRPAHAIQEVPAAKASRPQSAGDVSAAKTAKQESEKPLAEGVQSEASPREETKPVTTNAEVFRTSFAAKHYPSKNPIISHIFYQNEYFLVNKSY